MAQVTEGLRVRFSVVEEFEYKVDEFTAEEKALLWYTTEDMFALAKYEIKLCEENNRKAGCTWRGLEHMQTGEDLRQARVADILDAILDAYDDIGADDVAKEDDKIEQLSNACRGLTRGDRKSAYKWGLRDASVAAKIHEEETAPKEKRKHVKKTFSESSKSPKRVCGKDNPPVMKVRSKDSPAIKSRVQAPRMNPIAA